MLLGSRSFRFHFSQEYGGGLVPANTEGIRFRILLTAKWSHEDVASQPKISGMDEISLLSIVLENKCNPTTLSRNLHYELRTATE